MPELPQKLKIGGIEYAVRVGEVGPGQLAFIDRTSNTIHISHEIPMSQQWLALCHEVFHGLNNELRETQVDSLAVGIHQVLVDNGFLPSKREETR